MALTDVKRILAAIFNDLSGREYVCVVRPKLSRFPAETKHVLMLTIRGAFSIIHVVAKINQRGVQILKGLSVIHNEKGHDDLALYELPFDHFGRPGCDKLPRP